MHKAWSNIEEVPYCFSRSPVKFQGHTGQNCRFWSELCVAGLYLQFEFINGFEMMHKACCSVEEVPYCFPRSSVKFQGHIGRKTSILTQIGRFQTVNLVWIHWWLWNDAQSLKQHKKVPYRFSRSSVKFWPKLSVSGLQLQFEFSDGFEMMHNAWCGMEMVPYHFSWSSIKCQGHTGWKIDDLDKILARSLGRSQLSNSSDLPCL